MKLFQTSNIEVIRLAQSMFNFVLPSQLIERRSVRFLSGKC